MECAPHIPADAICFICRNDGAAQGLVTGCGCHGGDGIAHLTCLARMAQADTKEWEETGGGHGIEKWGKCFQCGQGYHGAVSLALGWAQWKTYVSRSEDDTIRFLTMSVLGGKVEGSGDPHTGLQIMEAYLSALRRFWPESKEAALQANTHLSVCYEHLARHDEALELKRAVYEGYLRLPKPIHEHAVLSGNNYTGALLMRGNLAEAKRVARQTHCHAKQTLDDQADERLGAACRLAEVLSEGFFATRADLLEAEVLLVDVTNVTKFFGPHHPRALAAGGRLQYVRKRLALGVFTA